MKPIHRCPAPARTWPGPSASRSTASSLRVLVALLLLSGFARGDEPPLTSLMGDPDAAERFDYCAWRFEDGGAAEALPDFQAATAEDTDERAAVAASMVEVGTEIALGSRDARACRKAFESARKSHERAWRKVEKQIGGGFDRSDDASVAAIQQQIHDLWAADQIGRRVYIASPAEPSSPAEKWQRRLAVSRAALADATSTAYLRELLEDWDWIDAHRFGARISTHAWLLVQHADDHPDFQADVLARMEPYLSDGGVRKRDYAYLWDRVAVNHGRLQRYGTQPDWTCRDGQLELKPLEDPDRVDDRRREMGLGPAAADLAEMARNVCGG